MRDPSHERLLSAVTVWELAIKASRGKLTLDESLPSFVSSQVERLVLILLPVSPEHAMATFSLPWHHRDPFDRMLVAQSLTEHVPLVTGDRQIARYGVEVIW